jgi:hypothetical protein
VVLLSYLSRERYAAACAIYEEEFWIVGGYNGGYLDTVESFSFRYDLCFYQSLVLHETEYRKK